MKKRQKQMRAGISGRLALARAGWLALFAAALAVFAWGLVRRYEGLRALARAGMGTALARLGWTPEQYAGANVALEVAFALGFLLVAAVIFARRSDEWPGILISLLLVAFGVGLPGTTYALMAERPIWDVPVGALQAIGWMSLLLFGYLFPNGRYVPRWIWLLVPPWVAWVLGFFTFGDALLDPRSPLFGLSFLVWVGWFATGGLALLYRYTRVASPLQRQQMKWVVFGFVLALVGAGGATVRHILVLTGIAPPDPAEPLYTLISAIALTLAVQIIPLSIGAAILRHRLFDVDLLINRTLVYGTLTGVLGALYLASVVLLEAALYRLTDAGGNLAIVISTLAIAALFQPLRGRVQTAIDRRFFRHKYDATLTLAEFSATLRAQVDLTRLQDDLANVVRRTMRPESVSLWLRPIARRGSHPRDMGDGAAPPVAPSDGESVSQARDQGSV